MGVEEFKQRSIALVRSSLALAGNTNARIGLAVILVAVLAWVFWPEAKPPAPCPSGARPGQVVPDMDRTLGRIVYKLVGSDCKLAERAATADEVQAAQERLRKWQAYDRTRSQAATLQSGGDPGLYKRISSRDTLADLIMQVNWSGNVMN